MYRINDPKAWTIIFDSQINWSNATYFQYLFKKKEHACFYPVFNFPPDV